MKLKIEHLAPYLPYKLLLGLEDTMELEEMIGLLKDEVLTTEDNYEYSIAKPILRPLSEVKNYFLELWAKGDSDTRDYFDADYLGEFNIDADDTDFSNIRTHYLPYGVFYLLAKNHFDLFDLISLGLAIDINTLEL